MNICVREFLKEETCHKAARDGYENLQRHNNTGLRVNSESRLAELGVKDTSVPHMPTFYGFATTVHFPTSQWFIRVM